MGNTRLPQFLKQRAFLTPNRTAMTFEGRSWTFHELYQEVCTFAGKLAHAGVREGQLVGLQMKNKPEMVFLIHGLFLLGAKIILINGRLSNSEREWQLQDAGAAWFISEEPTDSLTPLLYLEEMINLSENSFSQKEEVEMGELATIMYTSGTTGKPKAVMQTYGNHYWSATSSALNLGLVPDDKWLCMMPLFHISGLSILFRTVIYGIEMALHQGFDAKKANNELMSGGITIASVVSTALMRMIDDLDASTKYPPKFRCMLLGGGSAPVSLLERALEKRIPVFQTYGMTETSSQIATLAPEDSMKRVGSSGKPLFPCRIKIMKTPDQEALPGEEGEIAVSGPNVTKGYLHGEKQEAFRDEWFYTGDIGYMDSEGYLYVLDRRSDLIISGGENIYPAEIESVLMEHSAISEAGVTGLEDPVWGMVPGAALVMKDNRPVDLDVIREHCEARLARYKIPKQFLIVDQLPRNASNKLIRKDLKKYF